MLLFYFPLQNTFIFFFTIPLDDTTHNLFLFSLSIYVIFSLFPSHNVLIWKYFLKHRRHLFIYFMFLLDFSLWHHWCDSACMQVVNWILWVKSQYYIWIKKDWTRNINYMYSRPRRWLFLLIWNKRW